MSEEDVWQEFRQGLLNFYDTLIAAFSPIAQVFAGSWESLNTIPKPDSKQTRAFKRTIAPKETTKPHAHKRRVNGRKAAYRDKVKQRKEQITAFRDRASLYGSLYSDMVYCYTIGQNGVAVYNGPNLVGKASLSLAPNTWHNFNVRGGFPPELYIDGEKTTIERQ